MTEMTNSVSESQDATWRSGRRASNCRQSWKNQPLPVFLKLDIQTCWPVSMHYWRHQYVCRRASARIEALRSEKAEKEEKKREKKKGPEIIDLTHWKYELEEKPKPTRASSRRHEKSRQRADRRSTGTSQDDVLRDTEPVIHSSIGTDPLEPSKSGSSLSEAKHDGPIDREEGLRKSQKAACEKRKRDKHSPKQMRYKVPPMFPNLISDAVDRTSPGATSDMKHGTGAIAAASMEKEKAPDPRNLGRARKTPTSIAKFGEEAQGSKETPEKKKADKSASMKAAWAKRHVEGRSGRRGGAPRPCTVAKKGGATGMNRFKELQALFLKRNSPAGPVVEEPTSRFYPRKSTVHKPITMRTDNQSATSLIPLEGLHSDDNFARKKQKCENPAKIMRQQDGSVNSIDKSPESEHSSDTDNDDKAALWEPFSNSYKHNQLSKEPACSSPLLLNKSIIDRATLGTAAIQEASADQS